MCCWGEALTLRATNSLHLTGMGNVLGVVAITTSLITACRPIHTYVLAYFLYIYLISTAYYQMYFTAQRLHREFPVLLNVLG